MFSRVRQGDGARPSDGADRAAVADGPEPDPAQHIDGGVVIVDAQSHGNHLDVTPRHASEYAVDHHEKSLSAVGAA